MSNLKAIPLTAPKDYTRTSQQLTFSATNTRQVVTIPITDDTIVEDVEEFLGRLSLVTTGVSVQLSPQDTKVQIIDDNDSKCSLIPVH